MNETLVTLDFLDAIMRISFFTYSSNYNNNIIFLISFVFHTDLLQSSIEVWKNQQQNLLSLYEWYTWIKNHKAKLGIRNSVPLRPYEITNENFLKEF